MAEVKQLRGSRMVRNMLSRFVLALVIAIPAFGQATQFEYVYGGDCSEVGNDVKPIVAEDPCEGGGYIAVGTTNSVTNNDSLSCLSHTDVYVVRTNSTGGRLWERRYDITGSGSNDQGNAVIECRDGSGFVIAGTTTYNLTSTPVSAAFLMKIDCDGVELWTETYINGTSTKDSAYDLVEAISDDGNTALADDLLVCGTTESSNSRDGLIFRTTSTGTLVWSRRIKLDNSHESLFSLAEAPTGTPTDVVAAGRYIPANAGTQGYAVRVSAFTGNITAAPQGAAAYGGAGDESFNSVKVLVTSPETDNLVFVGWSTTPSNGVGQDIYLVKTGPNPCMQLADNTIDNLVNPLLTTREAATDVVEELNGGTFIPQNVAIGDLVLTGRADVSTSSGKNAEMFILPVTSGLRMFPGGAGGQTFGDINPGLVGPMPEGGAALEEVADGFILCGFSQGNLENDNFQDPEDLYLIKTDGDGATRCGRSWTVVETVPNYAVTCLTVDPTSSADAEERTPGVGSTTSDNEVCDRPDTCSHCKRNVQPAHPHDLPTEGSITMHVVPNPLPNGMALRIDLSGVEGDILDIVVTDLSGREIYRQTSPAPWTSGTLVVPTDGWAAGSYQVTVRNGSDRSRTTRVLVP